MMLLAPALLFLAALAQDPEAERLKREVDKLKADNEVLLRQVEVYAAQMKELNEKMPKLGEAKEPKSTADLIREEQMKQAVQALFLEAELKAMRGAKALTVPTPTTPAPAPDIVKPGQQTPRAAIDATVTAVANELGMVVLSVGKDDTVQVGDEFTVYRGKEFVAKVKIDRADRKWSAGKVIVRNSDPRVADSASNYISMTAKVPASAPAPSRGSAEELRSLRKELDDVCAQVRILSDRVIPSWQEEGLATEDLSEALRSQLRISKGLLIRQVREGSAAAQMGFKPFDVVPDLGEPELLRLLKEGGKITIYRKGTLETLQRVRSR